MQKASRSRVEIDAVVYATGTTADVAHRLGLDIDLAQELDRLTLTDIDSRRANGGGISWTALLCQDGEPALEVGQMGFGGSNSYTPPGRASGRLEDRERFASARQAERRFETLARRATGLAHEALDAVTAAMEEGETALRGVIRWKAFHGQD